MAYNHDRLTFSGTPESLQIRMDAAKQTIPIGASVRILSSNKRVKSNPCRQEGATIGPKASSSTEQSNMAVGNLGMCTPYVCKDEAQCGEKYGKGAGDRWCLKWYERPFPRFDSQLECHPEVWNRHLVFF